MSSKGITPVIATILLLMMTVSAAAGAYYWITTVQSNLQQQAQGAVSSSGISGSYRVSILSGGVTCTASGNSITVYAKNSGADSIPAGTWYLFLKDTKGDNVGTWTNSTVVGVFSSGDTKSIDFALDSGSGMSVNNIYTMQMNPPKGTSATTSCKAD
jgi:flagellin-like protein